MPKIRLDKFVSNLGKGSRKEVKNSVRKGLISVNGHVVNSPEIIIDPEKDRVFFCGEKLFYDGKVYIMMNKPKGFVSANSDENEPTVMELLGEEINKKDLFVVGRLDKDTEGFLLLTNDGEFAHNILSPKKHVPKTYFAIVDGLVTDDDKYAFENGIILGDGYKCLSANLEILKSDLYSEIKLTINEGKFHQVKRMFVAVNKKVKYLKRIKIGGLKLDSSLELGKYKKLSSDDIIQILN